MVKSADNGSASAIAPFLNKCYEMVDDSSTDDIISWGSSNDSFVVFNRTEFCVQLLPKYFKHSNFSSFVRQLNIYGFRKIDADRWEFANEAFIRGQKDLLKNITRRKYPQGSDQGKAAQPVETSNEPCEDVENLQLWKEVENLKIDKNALTQELVKLRQNQETADNKLMLLKDRLQGMESNQQQMLSFLIMAMQSPSFLFQLLKPKETNWRVAEAGNMLDHGTADGKPVYSDGMMVRYQPPMDGASNPVIKPVIDSGVPPEYDASSGGMKDFWLDIDFVKVLMDDSHIPFAPPDLHDDGAWENLLRANPFLENGERGEKEKESPTNSGMEVEETESETHLRRSHNFERMLHNMGSRQNFDIDPILYGSQLDASGNLQLLTEQMEHLASESNQRDDIPSN